MAKDYLGINLGDGKKGFNPSFTYKQQVNMDFKSQIDSTRIKDPFSPSNIQKKIKESEKIQRQKMKQNPPVEDNFEVVLDEIVLTGKAPEWLQYRKEFEKNNPMGPYIHENRSRWANRQDLIDKYERETNQYIYDQLIKNNPKKTTESRAEYVQRIAGDDMALQNIIEQNKNRHSSTSENVYTNFARGYLGMSNSPFAKAAKTALETNTYAPYEREQITNSPLENIGNMAEIVSVPYNATVGAMYTRGQGQDNYNMASGLSGQVPENRNTWLEIGADPFNAVGVGAVSKGSGAVKAVQQFGKYATESTPLRNAYKLNPWAFKPNPEAYYRGVGKEGIKDALKTGVIKSRDVDLFPSPYFARPNEFETALYYNPNGLIEAKGIDVSKVKNIEPNQLTFRNQDAGAVPLNSKFVDEVYLGNDTPGYKPAMLESIPVSNPNIRLLQKDWLKGYKEVPKYKVLNKTNDTFKSEIDWGKWNEEIVDNKNLMQEYLDIERKEKKNKTWLKFDDGSNFKGTPEQFVQMRSKNLMNFVGGNNKTERRLNAERFYKDPIYRAERFAVNDYTTDTDKVIFGTNDLDVAASYSGGNKNILDRRKVESQINKTGRQDSYNDGSLGSISQLAIPNTAKTLQVEASGNRFNLLPYHKLIDPRRAFANTENIKKYYNYLNRDNLKTLPKDYNLKKLYAMTDDYAYSMKKNKNNPYGVTVVNNVIDGGGKTSKITMIDPIKTPIKSLFYNNGMFDIKNPNIYKSVVPAVGGAALLNSQYQKQEADNPTNKTVL